MKICDIAQIIEEFAPLSLQAEYDNSGLVVGRMDDEVRSALLAVDVTEEVIDEAIEHGCDIIITHHPIIFTPLKRLNSANYVERCVERAIRHNIALYACHTNLDSVKGGTSWHVGEMLGLESMRILEPRRGDDSVGYGVVGELPTKELAVDFLRRVKRLFNVGAVRHSDIPSEGAMVGRVAICTGAGRSNINDAMAAEADVYITADLRYNDFMCGENRMILADIGHFESEFCAIRILDMVLSKKMCNFAVRKSERSRNPIHYLL